MPDAMQRDLTVIRENRRIEGLPTLVGRQTLPWGIIKFPRDEVRDKNLCRQAMQALRDAIKQSTPTRSNFHSWCRLSRATFQKKAQKT